MHINEIIEIEKQLLEFEDKHKFEISLKDLVFLNNELKRIGEITSLYFDMLCKYSKEKPCTEEELQEYKEKLSDCNINIDLGMTKAFLTTMQQIYG